MLYESSEFEFVYTVGAYSNLQVNHLVMIKQEQKLSALRYQTPCLILGYMTLDLLLEGELIPYNPSITPSLTTYIKITIGPLSTATLLTQVKYPLSRHPYHSSCYSAAKVQS